MTDRDALLRSVCANPDADAPRLVFADWLEENGAPERAEFIRLQCELAELAQDGSESQALYAYLSEHYENNLKDVDWEAVDPGMARRLALRARAASMLTKRRVAWKRAEAPARCGVSWNGFERGFVAAGVLTSARILASEANAVLDQVPALRLTVDDFSPQKAGALAGSAVLGRVRALHLGAGTAEAIRVLGEAPAAANIRELVISFDADGAARAIAATANWRGLHWLDLRDAGEISADAAEKLLGAKHLRGLTELRIADANWPLGAIRALTGNHFTELRTLALHRCGLRDTAAEALAGAASLKNLRSLELPGNNISGKGATSLLASPHLKHLTVLSLFQNPVRRFDAARLVRAAHGALRVLQLESGSLIAADVAALADCPALRGLRWLDLESNELRDAAVKELARTTEMRHLAVLNLLYNKIGDAGLKALATWPGLIHVQSLHLNGNTFGEDGAKALAASPHLADLSHVCFSKGTTGAAGVKALKKRFGRAAKAL